ncbi:MAG: type II toxin-antitoxin system VapC family toxin [Planctomycetes bacterium]|nr:type II toxin-antitoxin system VapC family toxin [Planctomycetota bacterium]
MRVLLDTDVCSEHLKRKLDITDRLKEVGLSNVFISRATIAELQVMPASKSDPGVSLEAIDDLISAIAVVEIDVAAWSLFPFIKAALKRKGRQPNDKSGTIDILNACVAFELGLSIATYNIKDYEALQKVKGNLQLLNWKAI